MHTHTAAATAATHAPAPRNLPPIVLIHGMWSTPAVWDRMRGLLQARGYRCFAPALPAHEPTPDQPLRVARLGLKDYLAHLEAEIAAQGFSQPPVLIGHSMGGLLAQQLAARIRPLALVLLTPATPAGINALSWPNLVAFSRPLTRWGFWRQPHKPLPERAARSHFRGLPAERHNALYQGLVHESGRALFEIGLWWADFSRASAVDARAVSCPVYIVSAGLDVLTPPGVVRKLLSRYPQASHRYYPDRGHWVIDDDDTEDTVVSLCSWLRPMEQRAARVA